MYKRQVIAIAIAIAIAVANGQSLRFRRGSDIITLGTLVRYYKNSSVDCRQRSAVLTIRIASHMIAVQEGHRPYSLRTPFGHD